MMWMCSWFLWFTSFFDLLLLLLLFSSLDTRRQTKEHMGNVDDDDGVSFKPLDCLFLILNFVCFDWLMLNYLTWCYLLLFSSLIFRGLLVLSLGMLGLLFLIFLLAVIPFTEVEVGDNNRFCLSTAIMHYETNDWCWIMQ